MLQTIPRQSLNNQGMRYLGQGVNDNCKGEGQLISLHFLYFVFIACTLKYKNHYIRKRRFNN